MAEIFPYALGKGRNELRSPPRYGNDASAGNKSPVFQLVTCHFEEWAYFVDIPNGLKDDCQICIWLGLMTLGILKCIHLSH